MTKRTTKGASGERELTSPAALDVISQALRRRHTLRPYGFQLNQLDETEISREQDFDELEGTPAFKRLGEALLWEGEQEAGGGAGSGRRDRPRQG